MKKAILGSMILAGILPAVFLQHGCVGDFAPLSAMVLTATPTPTVAPPTPTKTSIPTSFPGFIDDMEDNNNGIMTNQGRGGYWYNYNDGTGGGVQQTGGVAGPFTMGAPGIGFDGTGTSGYAVRVSTNAGFTNYGSGFGFAFINPQGNYDASAHSGIQLYARNTTGSLNIKFLINDEAVNTAVPAYSIGGHRMLLTLNTSWVVYQFPLTGPNSFATNPNDYGGPTVFDPTRVQQAQWAIPPAVTTDVWIDNISFY